MAHDPYESPVGPFSVAIFSTPDGQKRQAVYYGADERALYEADFSAASEFGYCFQGMWQPVWERQVNHQSNIGGSITTPAGDTYQKGYTDADGNLVTPAPSYYQDAYGVYRQVGNSDIID